MAWSQETNIKGPPGPPGPGMVFKGQVPTYGDLPTSAQPGDAYTVEADGHMYVWDGTQWIDGGDVVGPPGPPGADSTVPGPPGPPGPTDWNLLTNKPATFPPTLPIPSSGVTGLDAGQAAQDTAIAGKVAKAGDTMTGKLTLPASTTASAGLNLAIGAVPSAPAMGDVWASGSQGLSILMSAGVCQATWLQNAQSFTGTKTFTLPPIMATPTTAIASLRLPHGVAPSAPTNGDLWTTTAGFFTQINGAAVGPYAPLASPALTGNPTAPTAAPGDADTSIATTGFVAAAAGLLFGAIRVQTFTASGTYTPHANMLYCMIECCGGGGSGGSVTGTAANQTVSSGGGGGGYTRTIATKAEIGASKPVIVGGGGAAVGPPSGGLAGGDSSVGGSTLCLAKGGSGGSRGQSGVAIGQGGTGGGPGSGNGASITFTGGDGGGGMGAANSYLFCGWGGASGMGGGSTGTPLASNGRTGTGWGSGGSGASSLDATSYASGAGQQGIVRITEFCSS